MVGEGCDLDMERVMMASHMEWRSASLCLEEKNLMTAGQSGESTHLSGSLAVMPHGDMGSMRIIRR